VKGGTEAVAQFHIDAVRLLQKLWAVTDCRGVTPVTAADCLRHHLGRKHSAVPEAAEVNQMFMLYLLAEDTREFTILTRPKRFRLATMYNNESVWIVPGTMNEND
jgi:hypothetical protein